MIDVIAGLLILVVLTATLATSLARQDRAAQKLADSRAATRLAEQPLPALQTGRAPPTPEEGTAIDIVPLEPGDAAPPAGRAWVRVTVTRNGRSSSLIGLTRADAAGGGAK